MSVKGEKLHCFYFTVVNHWRHGETNRAAVLRSSSIISIPHLWCRNHLLHLQSGNRGVLKHTWIDTVFWYWFWIVAHKNSHLNNHLSYQVKTIQLIEKMTIYFLASTWASLSHKLYHRTIFSKHGFHLLFPEF